jgi:hypothetical protein
MSGYVALREQLSLAYRSGQTVDPQIEQHSYDLRDSIRSIVDKLCQADSSFRISMPAAAASYGSSCIDVVGANDPDGGYATWRAMAGVQEISSADAALEDTSTLMAETENLDASFNGFGLLPIIILIGVAVVSISAVGAAYFLTDEGRTQMATTLKQAELAEQYADLIKTGKASPADVVALQASLPKVPPTSGGLTGTLTKILIGGAIAFAAITWGPQLLAKFTGKRE